MKRLSTIIAALAIAGCTDPVRTETRIGFIQRVTEIGVIQKRYQVDLWEVNGLDATPHILACAATDERTKNQADDAANTGHRVRVTLKVVPSDMPVITRIYNH